MNCKCDPAGGKNASKNMAKYKEQDKSQSCYSERSEESLRESELMRLILHCVQNDRGRLVLLLLAPVLENNV
jgi:hypothetical protein